jgi:hypothetical protein
MKKTEAPREKREKREKLIEKTARFGGHFL